MAEGNGNDRISVSRETLRAELAEVKLDLLDRLASRSSVENLASQVTSLDQRVMLVEQEVRTVVVRKDGPMAQQIRESDRRIQTLEDRHDNTERGFTRGQRLLAALTALAVLALQVYASFHV